MAEGVRIRHTVLRGPAVVAVRDVLHKGPGGGPNGDQYPGCSKCQLPPPGHEGHKVKHVKIDADGYALVAVEYWADLQTFVDNGGFEYSNPVPEPPRQSLDFNGVGFDHKVHHKIGRPILTKNLPKKGSA